MFVQVIRGRTNDAAGLRRQAERWRDEVKPGAIGFLGGTGGVADDGTSIFLARFADEASAKANADRPEQGEWWAEMAKCFDGEPTFEESSDAETLFDGGADNAGFVQIMEGTISDRAKAEALEAEMMDQVRAARPDLIGGLRVWLGDNRFLQTAYFTSEEAARKGESSPDFSGPQQAYGDLFGDMTFLDLREPIFT